MRALFTNYDVKNIMKNVFDTDYKIDIYDSDGEFVEEKKAIDYLNIEFYAWKDRLVETEPISENVLSTPVTFESWLESLNYSMNKAYALVETTNSSVTASQDIDNATLSGKVTFLIQSNKLSNLDYYVQKLRNEYLGVPQEIQTANGDILKAYINIGIVLYDEDPTMTQLGETCLVSLNFAIAYMNNALGYTDTKIEFSLDNQTYYEIPFTKATFQNIPTSLSVPVLGKPASTGFITSSWTQIATIAFFDFDTGFTKELNKLFWKIGALTITGDLPLNDVNIPVFLKVTSDGKIYTYKYKLDNLEKVISNSDFNISSMTLKTWGKN